METAFEVHNGSGVTLLTCLLVQDPDEATLASLAAIRLTESGDSVESGEEYFDTSEHLEAVSGGEGASVMALVQPSPAVSITTLEGDPPDVEEDCDNLEQEDMEGQIYVCGTCKYLYNSVQLQCLCFWYIVLFVQLSYCFITCVTTEQLYAMHIINFCKYANKKFRSCDVRYQFQCMALNPKCPSSFIAQVLCHPTRASFWPSSLRSGLAWT